MQIFIDLGLLKARAQLEAFSKDKWMGQQMQNNLRLMATRADISDHLFFFFFPQILIHSLVSREFVFLKEFFKITAFHHRAGERFGGAFDRYPCKEMKITEICSLML